MPCIIPTCETAVSTLPEWHRAAFASSHDRVTSAEGWSPGALNLAQGVASKLREPLVHNAFSRLLIDLACAPDDPARWSDVARSLTEEQREKLDLREQKQFLEKIENRLAAAQRQAEEPVHVSFDTQASLGSTAVLLQYETGRRLEAEIASSLVHELRQLLPGASVDTQTAPPTGLAQWLKQRHPHLASLRLVAHQQSFLTGQPVAWTPLKKAVVAAFAAIRQASAP